MGKYDKYIHMFFDDKEEQRFAVALKTSQGYWCPYTKAENKKYGLSAEVSPIPKGLGGYKTYEQAYNRAKYLFTKLSYLEDLE